VSRGRVGRGLKNRIKIFLSIGGYLRKRFFGAKYNKINNWGDK
jgi:hypothetical protein